jgi:hypothetical protein
MERYFWMLEHKDRQFLIAKDKFVLWKRFFKSGTIVFLLHRYRATLFEIESEAT